MNISTNLHLNLTTCKTVVKTALSFVKRVEIIVRQRENGVRT